MRTFPATLGEPARSTGKTWYVLIGAGTSTSTVTVPRMPNLA